jgi:starch synthase
VKVVISTAGRFHLFALARELNRSGDLDRIFSGFAWNALKREDVQKEKVTTYPWFRTPYMAASRFGIKLPTEAADWLETMSCRSQDSFVSKRLGDSDVFVGHDGAGIETGRVAKRRGILYVCDTGTTHVRYRNNVLAEEYQRNGLGNRAYNKDVFSRQLEEYSEADFIVVPSRYARDSFIHEGVPPKNIKVIPYGVRTDHFFPSSAPPIDVFRILFVGSLSVGKGARYLLEAFERFSHPNKELFVVGSVGSDVQSSFSKADNSQVVFLGHIANTALRNIYSTCHVLVLPSIDEGFGMVLAEALACGCPVIATTNTGAPDLYSDGIEGFIVPPRDSVAIRDCFVRIADETGLRERMSGAALSRIREIDGWRSYGNNYRNFLVEQRTMQNN